MVRLSAQWERLVTWAAARRLPLVAVGVVVAALIVVYSDPVRNVLAWIWEHLVVGGTLVALAVAAVFALAWWARGQTETFALSKETRQERQRARHRVAERELEIGPETFPDDLPEDQAVVGRRLRYLERVTGSDELVVMVHGLGLDAEEFRPAMRAAEVHTVAVTQFGMNARDAEDASYLPIGLTAHADLLSGTIAHVLREHPDKRLHLVGFSVGADMLLRLAELWEAHPERRPTVVSALLLDPHVNHAGMAITGSMAHLDPTAPLAELKRVAATPEDEAEFRRVCAYLSKVTGKDLGQIKQHARDLWEYAEGEGRYGEFMARVERLRTMCGTLRVCFSRRFEDSAEELAKLAPQRGLTGIFETRPLDHFQLTAAEPLNAELAAITAPEDDGDDGDDGRDGHGAGGEGGAGAAAAGGGEAPSAGAAAAGPEPGEGSGGGSAGGGSAGGEETPQGTGEGKDAKATGGA